jgi:hypothetical protein
MKLPFMDPPPLPWYIDTHRTAPDFHTPSAYDPPSL